MITEIIVKATGEKKTAVYAANSGGNMRYNVDGKFYSDKKFNELFLIVPNEAALLFKVHVRKMFDEIRECGGPAIKIMDKPIAILYGIICKAAERAGEINDDEMIGYFCRLGLYEFSDPSHKDYDADLTNAYIQKTLKTPHPVS